MSLQTTKLEHTPGPWRVSKQGNAIVADIKHAPEHCDTGHAEEDYYGGLLICESVLPNNLAILESATCLLEAAENMVRQIELSGYPTRELFDALKDATQQARGEA